ncbi:hypothetical protein NIES4071_16100 [Calothrix sp. NIES-4071]|nr:hypothetical protein NIES4071_16100 [Calothrix sp. NIES-4071]BAZ55946.1 hypothetical protein NIES4105_16050 [Calothrix sp. NIES-4105]
MSDNAQKAIIQDHNIPNIFISLLMVFCGITVIYFLGLF